MPRLRSFVRGLAASSLPCRRRAKRLVLDAVLRREEGDVAPVRTPVLAPARARDRRTGVARGIKPKPAGDSAAPSGPAPKLIIHISTDPGFTHEVFPDVRRPIIGLPSRRDGAELARRRTADIEAPAPGTGETRSIEQRGSAPRSCDFSSTVRVRLEIGGAAAHPFAQQRAAVDHGVDGGFASRIRPGSHARSGSSVAAPATLP